MNKKNTEFLNVLVTVATLGTPITLIPQIFTIWHNKSCVGVSLITWVLLLIFTIVLLIEGIKTGKTKLNIMWGLLCICYIFIIVGILLYR